jgi:Spy/CpxP family protein refolding chaperone
MTGDNTMKRKIVLAVLAVSLALNAGMLSTVGFHWLHYRGPGRGDGPGHGNHFRKILRLTDAQSQSFDEDRARLDAAIDPLQKQLRSKKMELVALMKATDTYTTQIDALVTETAGLQTEIEKTFIRHSFNVRRNLTPEQQDKFNELLEKGFRRRGPGGDEPGGPRKCPK